MSVDVKCVSCMFRVFYVCNVSYMYRVYNVSMYHVWNIKSVSCLYVYRVYIYIYWLMSGMYNICIECTIPVYVVYIECLGMACIVYV